MFDFVVITFLVLIIIFTLALMEFDWRLSLSHFGSRAADSAATGAGAALNRIFNGAGAAVDIPGQVKDKIEKVINDTLGTIGTLIVVGTGIEVIGVVVVATKAIRRASPTQTPVERLNNSENSSR